MVSSLTSVAKQTKTAFVHEPTVGKVVEGRGTNSQLFARKTLHEPLAPREPGFLTQRFYVGILNNRAAHQRQSNRQLQTVHASCGKHVQNAAVRASAAQSTTNA